MKVYGFICCLILSTDLGAEVLDRIEEKCWSAYSEKNYSQVVIHCKEGAKLGGKKSLFVWAQHMVNIGNYAEAISLYGSSGELGYGRSYSTLGKMYSKGFGVIRNDCTAEDYYRKGAELGDRLSNKLLGNSLFYNLCAAHAPEEALDYMKSAAMQDIGSQYIVALIYSRMDDYVSAYAWMSIAQENGYVFSESEADAYEVLKNLVAEATNGEVDAKKNEIRELLSSHDNV